MAADILPPPVEAGISEPVRDLPPFDPATAGGGLTTETEDEGTSASSTSSGEPDPVVQTDSAAGEAPVNDDLTAPLVTFQGQDANTVPDTVGDVGPNHYVQMINTSFQIWNKDGTSPAGGGPFAINSLWTSNSVNDNGCDTQNAGDPIVLYDQTVDRWMLAQFTTPRTAPFDMCIAYSQTADPTGAFFTYSFRLCASHDYEKFGIWPDGLYMSTYEGGSNGAYAFDRAAMIGGSPATFQYFGSGACALGAGVPDTGRARLFPSDWDGTNPPAAGEPNHFLVSRDSDNGQGGAQDGIDIYDFHVDWTTPANSTFGLAQTLNTAPFDINFNCVNTLGDTIARECIPTGPTPATGTNFVDVLPGRLMHRVQYRNFGSYSAMVAVQSSVDADGNNRSGQRWYEFRNTGAGWTIHQQGTYAPGTAHRWMGSIAMDKNGNIGLGYSIVDPTLTPVLFPSVAYTGRLASAPLGSLPEIEKQFTPLGAGAQNNFARWGDYSSMNVDPVDDCTFWYTQQYGGTQQTLIGSFRFTSCSQTDVSITKVDSPDPVYAGNELTYTLTATNNGPNTAENVTVTDTLPAGVTFISATAPCVHAAGVVTCAIGSLLSGQSVPIVIQVGVPSNFLGSAATKTLTNTATIAAANQFDPDESNNTVTQTTTVQGLADLGVTKICKPDEPQTAGESAYCDIHVDNLGPSDAVSVSLKDVLTSATPFEVTGVTVSPSGTCAPTNSAGPTTTFTTNCDLGTEPAGGRSTIRVTVVALDVAQINDVATVSSATNDPNTDNNQAVGRIDYVGSADLSLDKTAPESVVAGTQMTYGITVTNGGPSVAKGVVVHDVMPEGVSFVSVTPSQGSCTNGQPGDRDLVCGLGNLADDAVATIQVEVLVSPDVPAGTILFNEAVVSSSTGDPDNDDVRDSVPTNVTTLADLSVVKLDSPDAVLAGNPLSYTVTVSNGGPSTATNVTVVDTLPAGVTFVDGQDGNGATVCTLVQTATVVCALGSMQPGDSETVYLTVKVSPSVPKDSVLTNTVSVNSSTTDPNAANNTTSADTLVDTAADLWLDKTGELRSGNPSPMVVYGLTVHNDSGCETDAQSTATPTCGTGGPSDAQGITVTDTLPLTPKKLVVQYLSPQCAYAVATHTVTCTATTVPAGASVLFVIEAQIQGSVGTILNSASLTSATFDPALGNNSNDVTLVHKGGTGKKG